MRSVTSPNHARQLHPLFHSFSILQSLQSGIKLQKVYGMQMRFSPPFEAISATKNDSEKRVQGTPSKMYQINSKISRSFRLNRGTVVMDDIRTKGTSFSERLKLAPLNPMSLSTYTGPMASCITKACSHRHLAPVQTMDQILTQKVGFQGSNLESS